MTTKVDPFKIRRRSYSVVSTEPVRPYSDLCLEQGTPEWLAARSKHITASDVASIMGVCPYRDRSDILNEKLTGQREEISDYKRQLFDKGHAAEVEGRRWVNDKGRNFTPAVLVSVAHPFLLASLDGFDREKNEILEAKYLGAAALKDVADRKLKTHHAIQVQAQLLISGASRCLYFAMDPNGNAQGIPIYPDAKAMSEIVDACRIFYAEWQKAVKA